MIALGCDHGGYELKQEIIAYLEKNHLEYKDFGCFSKEAVDYPEYAKLVGHAVDVYKRQGHGISSVKFSAIRKLAEPRRTWKVRGLKSAGK